IKTHDILLELNGKAVPNDLTQFEKMLDDIKPDAAVDAVVLRKGKKETIKGLKLPEAKEPAVPAFPAVPPAIAPPPLPAPPVPVAPGAFPGAFPGAPVGRGDVVTTSFRQGERFTVRHEEGSLIITLTGKAGDGKASVSGIHVQDGRESKKYESADKVPEEYRDKVQNLIELAEKTNAKIEVKKP